MNATRLQQIEELFDSALAVDPAVRDVFVRSHCGDDAELLHEVQSLLCSHAGSTRFLETPAIDLDTVFPQAIAAQLEREDPLVGTEIASYRVIRRLGAGGMGLVYYAEQRQPRRTVALKLIRPGLASPAVLQRFEHEALALGRLKHPGIAAIYEAGAAQTPLGLQPFFAMEYVSGRPLLEHAGTLTTRQRVELLAQIADAVQHAHGKGVIHRDLKPGNILVEAPDALAPDQSTSRAAHPKILDFGVARISDASARDQSMHTVAGAVIGTIPYMSPEQFASGIESTDTRSDIYALGVIAYETLTGRLPINARGLSLTAAGKAIAEEIPARPSSIMRSLRGDLDTILLKALEKDPGRRYQTASAFADDLRRVLADQPVLARPASAGYQFRKLVVRHKIPAVLSAAILALLIGFGVWMSILYTRADALRRLAERETDKATTAGAREQEQRRLAERRAESSRRVTNVLIESFRASDPTIFRSRDIEARQVFAEEILDVGTDRIARKLTDEPLLQAELELAFGQIYDNIGLYTRAMKLMEHALQTRRRLLGDDSPEVAEVLHFYAQSANAGGNPEQAYGMMREAVAIYEQRGLTASVMYSSALSQLGTYALSAGHLEQAMLAFDRAGVLKGQTPGHSHGMYAITLNGVAGVFEAEGKYADAEQILRKAIELAAFDYPPDAPIFGSLRNNLAWVLYGMRRYDAALEEARLALTLRTERLGKESSKVADSLLVVGVITAESGKPLDAEPMLRDALRIRLDKVSENKGLVGETQCALATCLGYLQRFDEGAPLMSDGIANLRAGYGARHPTVQRGLEEAVRFFTAASQPDKVAEYTTMLAPVAK